MKLDKDEYRMQACVMFAKGYTVQEVAKACNCSPTTAAKYKRERAELIQACRESLVKHTLPLAVKARQDLVEEYVDKKKRAKMPPDVRKHAHDHIMATHKAAGVYPDTQQASVIVKELNVDNKTLNVKAISSDKFMVELRKLIE